jgi:hypothetical protein
VGVEKLDFNENLAKIGEPKKYPKTEKIVYKAS